MYGQTIKLVETAREILKAQGYFIDNLWHIDDVHLLCEEKNLPCLTNEEAMEVFNFANQSFDGEMGLNWLQLGKAVDYFVKRKQLLETSLATK